MQIHFIEQQNIDKIKWNTCVYNAYNGNVFGFKWFLDQVGKDWDALVEGDYESVLPLVWRKYWFGGKEVYQPYLMRELGVYSMRVLSQKRIENFLDAIPPGYHSVCIALNEQNIRINEEKYALSTLINHQILLTEPYEKLRSAYSPLMLEQLNLAEEFNLLSTTSLSPEKVADFYKKHTSYRRGLGRNYHAVQRIMYNILHRGWGFASGIQDQQGDLLACNFFIYSHNRAISFLPMQSAIGKQKGALAYLMDVFIRNHAGRSLIFDLNTKADHTLAIALGAQENQYYQFYRAPGHTLGRLIAQLGVK
jgi:hypothetical protein